eukprot:3903347-Amphidinium_carterae.1
MPAAADDATGAVAVFPGGPGAAPPAVGAGNRAAWEAAKAYATREFAPNADELSVAGSKGGVRYSRLPRSSSNTRMKLRQLSLRQTSR